MFVARILAFMLVSWRAKMGAKMKATFSRLSAADLEAIFVRSTAGQQLHLNIPFQVGN